MTDKELEKWWEEDENEDEKSSESDVDAFGRPPAVPISTVGGPVTSAMIGLGAWGDMGSFGNLYIPAQYEINQMLQTNFDALKKFKRADEWICILRYADESKNILACIQSTEQLVCNSKTSIELKKEYSANSINLLYFSVLRAYARADEGDFDSAQLIWDEIVYSWLDRADDYRQPYILFHLFVTKLCSADWKKSIEHLNQMWSLIKFIDNNKRHSSGIWDEWVSALLVTWVFLQKSLAFDEVFCKDFDHANLFQFQKKSLLLPHLHPNFLGSLITESYYKKAKELNPELPDVQYKEKPIAELRL